MHNTHVFDCNYSVSVSYCVRLQLSCVHFLCSISTVSVCNHRVSVSYCVRLQLSCVQLLLCPIHTIVCPFILCPIESVSDSFYLLCPIYSVRNWASLMKPVIPTKSDKNTVFTQFSSINHLYSNISLSTNYIY